MRLLAYRNGFGQPVGSSRAGVSQSSSKYLKTSSLSSRGSLKSPDVGGLMMWCLRDERPGEH